MSRQEYSRNLEIISGDNPRKLSVNEHCEAGTKEFR